jgi:WD40 repeat protein/serine/threonine protein kinase
VARPETDRNLLFGILALQMDLVTRDQLVAAMNAWVLRKADPLAQVLVDQGALAADERALLEPMVALHVKRHGGDPERSLAAAGAQLSTRFPVAAVQDPELVSALQTLAPATSPTPDGDPDPSVTRDYRPPDPRPGGARYRIVREHAKGGLGVVFLAQDTELNRQVALKEIQHLFADDATSRARFLTEAEVTGGLEHPGIVPIYGLGRYDDGRPFYAMRFIRGDSLKDAIARFHQADEDPRRDPGERALSLQTLLRRFLDVCNAIQYAHDRGVLHRDLKPGNIMIGRYGETLVVDWGLAKVTGRVDSAAHPGIEATLRPGLSGNSSATVAGQALGTPAYMSPEQAQGKLELLGPASDVYSLGATLYALLTGHAPVAGGDPGAALARVTAGDFPPPRAVNPRVPRALDAVCLKAMALRATDRYGSARELAADVERFLADEPVGAAPEGLSQRLTRWGRKHRAAVQAGAGALLVILVLSAGFAAVLTRAYQSEKRRRQEAKIAEGHALEQKRRADDARGQAELQRAAADRARAETQRYARSVERQAALLLFDRGLSECEAGRANRGVLWLARALERAPRDEPGLTHVIQANLESWAPTVPTLKAQWQHRGQVTGVAFRPDGKVVLTGSLDNTARLWDAATGQAIGMPMAHKGQVWAVAFRPDGKVVVTASADNTARLWDAATGKPIGTPLEHKGGVLAVAFRPDGKAVLTGSEDNTARLWDAATGKPIGTPRGHMGPVLAVAFSPDGKVVLTGIAANRARLWDAATGQAIGMPLAHRGRVWAVAFSPDGKAVLTGSQEDNAARLWDAATGKPIGAPLEHKRGIGEVAFSPDGKVVLTGSYDNTARLWDAATGKPIGAPLEHKGTVEALAFSPDGQAVLTGSADNTARLWDAATGKPIGAPLEHKGRVGAVAFSPDGQAVLTGSFDSSARLWDAVTGRPIGTPLKHKNWVGAVAFSPDGKAVLTGSLDNTARLWDPSTGEPIGTPLEHKGLARAVAFRPDGKVVLTGSFDNTARLWDAASGQPIGDALEHKDRVTAVAFRPDGKVVLTGSADNTARLWDAATGKPIGAPLEHKGRVEAVAFSPDGKAVLTGSADNTARLWDVATGRAIGMPLAHKGEVWAVAFSPDGKVVLTGSEDNTARLWDARTGRSIGSPLAHKGRVGAVAFSPDGKVVVTGSLDNTARLWDAATGKPIGVPLEHKGRVVAVAFRPDGKVVLTGSLDNTARLWDAGTTKPIGTPLEHKGSVMAVAFSPDGKVVITASLDNTARLWDADRRGQASGDSETATLAVQAMTGLKIDESGAVLELDFATWEACRARAIRHPLLPPTPRDVARRGDRSWHEIQLREAAIAGQFFAARWHLARLVAEGPQAGPEAASSRRKALAWLRDLLDREERRLADRRPVTRQDVLNDLASWKTDEGLSILRDERALARLPMVERQECRDFWARVDAVLAEAGFPADPFAK